jgi:hypothetical protein
MNVKEIKKKSIHMKQVRAQMQNTINKGGVNQND